MLVLGIETSCDETAAAVVRGGRRVLSSCVFSQVKQHAEFGGVVPEVAARSHLETLPKLLDLSVRNAGVSWDEIDVVAVTYGPGLASSLLVGLSAAQALAMRLGKPLAPVNHLEAHLYSVFLAENAPAVDDACPMLVLLVTGGNTALVLFHDTDRYTVLGQTLDDAAGEALDKGASLLGLGYPGGPEIEKMARTGNPDAVRFPRGLEHARGPRNIGGLDRELCFSFSGVKTSLKYRLQKNPIEGNGQETADLAASYQAAVFDALMQRLERAADRCRPKTIACVGGVACNRLLRERVEAFARSRHSRLLMAPTEYCADNAAMIAGLAGKSKRSRFGKDSGDLDIVPNLAIGAELPPKTGNS